MMSRGENNSKNTKHRDAPSGFNPTMEKHRRKKQLEQKEKELAERLEQINKSVELEELREHGRRDFFYFCKEIMGFKDLYEPLHRPLCEFIANTESKRKLLLIPRGHFKTTIGSISYPIWKLINNPQERIALMSVTSDLSEDNLKELVMKIDDPRTQSLYGDILPYTKKWPMKRAFELRCPRRGSKVGPSLYSCGVESSETGRHFSTIIIDDMVNDQNTRSKDQLDKIWDWFGRQESVLDADGEFIVIGCLTGDTKVLMADGLWRDIKEVEPGEAVFTFEDGNVVPKMVEAMWPQGEADVVEVKTTNSSVKCTYDHPFLVLRDSPVYIKAEDLFPGDKILSVLEAKDTDVHRQVTLGKRCHERKYTKRFVDPDDMWLFGFIIGDGWIAKSKKRYHGVCVSEKEAEWKNEKIKALLKRWTSASVVYKEACRYYRVECAQAARELERLGLNGKSKTKRIPEWVFGESYENRRAFLMGLCNADGHKTKGCRSSYLLGLSNKDLIEDVKFLCATSGVKTGKTLYRNRWVQPPCSPEPVFSEEWSVTLNFDTKERYKSEYTISPVVSVTKAGREEVYDLSVEDNHNFCANRLMSGNTRWHYGDPYGRLEKLPDWTKMILSAINKQGKVIFPTVFTKKKLETIRKTQGDYRYSCFYENNPAGHGVNPFDPRRFQWVDYKEKDPDSWRYILVDPATTTNDWSHPSGIIIGDALAKEKAFVVVKAIREKLNPDQLVSKLIALCQQEDPYEVIVEADAAHTACVYWLRQKIADQKLGYYVKSIKNPVRIGRETRTINILQPKLHEGEILLASEMPGKDKVLEEFHSFPKGRSDDLIMALSAVAHVVYPRAHERPKHKTLDRRTQIFNNMIANASRKKGKRKIPRTRMKLWA